MQSFAGCYRQGCLSKCQTGDFLSLHGPVEANWQKILKIYAVWMCVAHTMFLRCLKCLAQGCQCLWSEAFSCGHAIPLQALAGTPLIHTCKSTSHKISRNFRQCSSQVVQRRVRNFSDHDLHRSSFFPSRQAYNGKQLPVRPVLEAKHLRWPNVWSLFLICNKLCIIDKQPEEGASHKDSHLHVYVFYVWVQ